MLQLDVNKVVSTDNTNSSKIDHEFIVCVHLTLKKQENQSRSFRIKVIKKNWGNQSEQKVRKEARIT